MHQKRFLASLNNLQNLLSKLCKEFYFSSDDLKTINDFQEASISFINSKEFVDESPQSNNLELPWKDPLFANAWNNWKEFKLQQFKFRYKPISESKALEGLIDKSNNDMSIAIQIINNSIQNGHSGLYSIKRQKKNSAPTENLNEIKYDN